jgi:hypothetical protein
MAQAVQFALGKQAADKQSDLLDQQSALLLQKIETEKAQTEDTVTAGAVAGLVGKQKALLTKQTDGFDRDAEQKSLKIMMDSYAVRRSTDVNASIPSQASDPAIDAFILKAASGINTSLPDTFTIGGTITGLDIVDGLTIQNNSGDDLIIPADATTFTFTTRVADNFDYDVIVPTGGNQTGQTIVITNETGTVAGADITNVLITVS